MRSYFGLNVEGLSFPLMALIDYKGFRLVSTLMLPIKDLIYGKLLKKIKKNKNKKLNKNKIKIKKKLLKGSKNAGKKIKNKDEKMNELMKETAQLLNLSGHKYFFFDFIEFNLVFQIF